MSSGHCSQCGTQNPPGMNFCRQCGNSLATVSPAQAPPAQAAPPPAGVGGMQLCPTCGGQTPTGFAFCQQCGTRLGGSVAAGAVAPGPGGSLGGSAGQIGGQIGESPGGPPPAAPPSGNSGRPGAVVSGEAIAETLAASQPRGPLGGHDGRATDVEASVAWGALVSVNRDGTDGDRYPLRGEFVVVGRSGADISFDDDTFLAPRHARVEHGDGGARVVPLDTLNGVYRRLSGPEPLADGTYFLAGREVMRFEEVSVEERDAAPLVRHGVHMFGSPPREPWGRLMQMLPNGGVRDVRFLGDPEIVIGREEGDLVFDDDAFLSRRHAALRWQNGRCVIEDLRSSNGTFMRLSGAWELRRGDHLRMGDQLFRFEPGL